MNVYTTAIAAVSSLGLATKGLRPAAAMAFMKADNDEDREVIAEHYGAGRIRRGLRQFALSAERKEAGMGDVFWSVRDMLDDDGTLFEVEDDALEAVAA